MFVKLSPDLQANNVGARAFQIIGNQVQKCKCIIQKNIFDTKYCLYH